MSEAAAINLPALHHIRRNIRLQRQANQQLPNPANRDNVPELPLKYQRSCPIEQFLIFDSGQGDADRIFIFGTDQSLQLLSQSQNWFGDGTFKVCPQMFFQIYTIHACSPNVCSPTFTLCSQTKPKGLKPDYSEKLNNT